jgi:hypothetical protein
MQPDAPKKKFAWQPLTPGGIALFAGAKLGRLLTVQFIFALVASAVIMRIFYATWVPVINRAVHELPVQGQIRRGLLQLPSAAPQILAENRFLGLAIDPKHRGDARSAAHIHVELGERELGVYSLSGYLLLPYPAGYRIALNHDETIPAWGAWRPAVVAGVGGLAFVWLFISWAILQSLYFIPVWLGGFLARRELTLAGSWKLCGAALMPGAVFFTLSLVVYGLGWLDLIRLAAAAAIHLVIGWIYLPFALAKLPRSGEKTTPKENPFTSTKATEPKTENPFK